MKTNDGIMKEMMEEERVQFFIEIVLSEGTLANILFVRTCLEIMNRKCGYHWDFQLNNLDNCIKTIKKKNMNEELIKQLLANANITMNSQQINFGDGVYNDYRKNEEDKEKLQDTPANHAGSFSSFQTDDAQERWKKLVTHKFCHVEGDRFVWDSTTQNFGRMVYFASAYGYLGINPATENVDWDMYLSFFGVAPSKKQQAKNEWVRIGKVKNTELCYDAEKLKIIFNS